MKKYIKPELETIEVVPTKIMDISVSKAAATTSSYLGKGDNSDSWDDED